jgi:hypothetical protein
MLRWNDLIRLPVHIPRLKIQGGECELRNFAIVLKNPVGNHVHSSTRTTCRPEIAIHNPLRNFGVSFGPKKKEKDSELVGDLDQEKRVW